MQLCSSASSVLFTIARRAFALAVLVCLLSTTAQAKSRVRKAVFIIVDGVAADVIEKLPTPNLDAIARQGGYTRSSVGGERGGYSQTPTISAVGYNSLLTGTWFNKHNVQGNDISEPNYHYPTIFRCFKETFPARKTAIFSSWLDNRTKLVGDKLPSTGNIPVDIHYDGLELDTTQFPHDAQKAYMERIDESVARHAAQSIRDEAPDLSWVYQEYTDDMGHMYGDSPEFARAVTLADQKVGYIWQAIQYRQQHFNEEWLLIVTTDHGRDAQTGKNHGGQSDRERSSWIVTNAQGLNAEFRSPSAAIVDIMPTLARFLGVKLSSDRQYEVDGVPFIGKVSALAPRAYRENGKVTVQWQAIERKGTMKVWLSTSNQFKTGGKDSYRLVAQVPVSQQGVSFEVGPDDTFAKVVLQAPDNALNRWVVPGA